MPQMSKKLGVKSLGWQVSVEYALDSQSVDTYSNGYVGKAPILKALRESGDDA